MRKTLLFDVEVVYGRVSSLGRVIAAARVLSLGYSGIVFVGLLRRRRERMNLKPGIDVEAMIYVGQVGFGEIIQRLSFE